MPKVAHLLRTENTLEYGTHWMVYKECFKRKHLNVHKTSSQIASQVIIKGSK